MKGIIFASGNGTRLYPITNAYSKQLVNIYDKPAIYYPLSVLMQANIKDILIITNKDNYNIYKRLLSDGSKLGINIKYKIQKNSDGCASGLRLCYSFVKNDSFCVLFGDNFIYSSSVINDIKKVSNNFSGAQIFCHKTDKPQYYGIANIKNKKLVSIEEKPKNPASPYAIMGIYLFDKNVFKHINEIEKSSRGEFEIPDINKIYLNNNKLKYKIIPEKEIWIDIGTPDNLFEASKYVMEEEKKNKKIIACLEEIAYKNKYITYNELLKLGNQKSEYGKYILSIKEE